VAAHLNPVLLLNGWVALQVRSESIKLCHMIRNYLETTCDQEHVPPCSSNFQHSPKCSNISQQYQRCSIKAFHHASDFYAKRKQTNVMMSQLERLYMSVYNISQELNKRGTIASYRYKELEDRLAKLTPN
jgi:hypothetical protein